MTLYARSDVCSIAIPVSSGGCGEQHRRPTEKNGSLKKVWGLNCPQCEAYLRGDAKRKVIRVTGGDKNKGVAGRMEHVPDSDPLWSNTPEGIPPTPDEEGVHAKRAEVGHEQLRMIEALAAARNAGMAIPQEAWWLLEKNLDPKLLQGTLLCSQGHENRADASFCTHCGEKLRENEPEPEPFQDEETSGEEPVLDLTKLHGQTLKKMCRERGLPDTGSKEDLIARLS